METWTNVKGYENYLISSSGRVKALSKTLSDGRKRKEKLLSPGKDGDGYFHVGLSNNNQRSTKKVHTLVAQAFIPNPENKPTVDHINRNIIDNDISNLRWSTRKEQANNRAYNRPFSKHLEEIKALSALGLSQKDIAFELSIHPSMVSRCLSGARRKPLTTYNL